MKQVNGEPTSMNLDAIESNHPAASEATAPNVSGSVPQATVDESGLADVSRWTRIITLAGLAVLGVTPWAQAQLAPLNPPPAVICPPLTAIATPTLFDVFFGTTPIRFPFQ